MNLGLRALLLIAAVILFVLAAHQRLEPRRPPGVGPRVPCGRTPRR